MPGLKATRLVRELQTRSTSPHILILTAYGDVENILGMLKAGAAGYLLKEEDPSVIADGIRAVAQGKTWLSRTVAANLLGHVVGDEGSIRQGGLSERELEVLRLVAQGYSNQRIAETLDISEGTVKNHVTNIYDKLKLHTRAEAVAWAWQRGLAESE